MAISNTRILIRRAGLGGSAAPTALANGEIGYSYQSNNFFIGSPDGTSALPIGGYNTYTQVNNATNANTVSTIVKRDASGAFQGRLVGSSTNADKLIAAQNFSITGDAIATPVSFDGTGAVALNASLNSINPNSGTFGSATSIPSITVGANGRITAVTTNSISTSFNINDGTTSNTINAGATLFQRGTKGITTAVTANTVTFSTDNTVVRSNTTTVGPQVINTDLTVTGNLTINGNVTTTNYQTLNVVDPLIYLAANNYYSDVVDIGFAGNYFDGTNERHTGFFRDATNKQYYVFDNYLPELSGNNDIDRANTSFRIATLNANLIATQANVTSDFSVGGNAYITGDLWINNSDINTTGTGTGTVFNTGVTTVNAFGAATIINMGAAGGNTNHGGVVSGINLQARGLTPSQQVIANNLGYLVSLANNSYSNTGTAGASATITSLQIDNFGRTSAAVFTPIAIDASAVTSGTLPIARGGTNNTSYTTNQQVYFNGTSIASLANVSYSNTGTAGASATITSMVIDNFGRSLSAVYTPIAIDASAITSGTLSVARGGTGNTTFQTSGVLFGNGTGAVQATALAGGAGDQTWSNQILTVNNSGVPTWTTSLDGGTF